ncbi:unnamed protein product [Schistocephalus solidus]|uniref:Reverse transcriptase domain-containing protein n=1 Tax=Schistocephalus solidus TaxID=70667 RepID=A0A183TGQ9_SCHSO|nr:unnamed protein product [Schistocephalus solidus]
MQTHLYTTFVDLTKAFDTVNRDALWKVMQIFSCPEWFTHMVGQLHDGMTARITDNGTVSEAFAVTNGVKQGCVLVPILSSLMFSAMLTNSYRNERPGILIARRTEMHLPNRQRLQAPTRVSMTTVHQLHFADDCILNTATEEARQWSIYFFFIGCSCFRLTINMKKRWSCIKVNGTQFNIVKNLAFLCGTLPRNKKFNDKVAHRIFKASQVFGRLQPTGGITPNRAGCPVTITRFHLLGGVTDAAAGRALIRHPTSLNPFGYSSVQNKLSCQLASHVLSPSTKPGQKVVVARASRINVACCGRFVPAAKPWSTVMTSGLNQVRVSGVVCVSTPGTSAQFPLLHPPPSHPHPTLLHALPPLSSSQPTLTLSFYPPLPPPTLQQPPRNLSAQYHREDIRPFPSQSSERSPTARTAPGKPMWLSKKPMNNRHDVRHSPATREGPEDTNSPIHYLRGSNESLRYGESRLNVEDHAEIRLSQAIHTHAASTP